MIVPALLLSSLAQADTAVSCWDGTFAYQTAAIRVSADGAELSMGGMSSQSVYLLGAPGLTNRRSPLSHALQAPYDGSGQLHAQLEPESCTVQGQSSVHCQQGETTLYMVRSVPELSGSKEVITPLRVQGISMQWTRGEPSTLKLSIEHDISGTQSMTLKLPHCNLDGTGNTSWVAPTFPERLRAHLTR
ncbi:MAG: hypothetical protein ACI8RZ_003205 [Myxococcota bacterium]|jgi:hypothetical protein